MNTFNLSVVRMRRERTDEWCAGTVVQLTRPTVESVTLELRDFAGVFPHPGDVMEVHLPLAGCFKARIDQCRGQVVLMRILEHLDPMLCEDNVELPGG